MKPMICRASALTMVMLGLLCAGATTVWAHGGPPKFLKLVATTPKMVGAGKPFTLTVAITIDKPYHIQGNPPKEGYIATVVSVGATPGFKIGKIIYPKAMLAKIAGDTLPVYEGEIEVKALVTPTKSGKFKLPISVRYQGCNESACYPPNTVTAEATVLVGGKTVVLAK